MGVSPAATPVASDRRQNAELGHDARRVRLAGTAPQQHEPADLVATGWQPLTTLIAARSLRQPAVIALTIRLAHRGRAPPSGSLLR